MFRIDERTHGRTLRLILSGELDIGSAAILDERLDRYRANRCPVRLDLANVSFIDSSGVHVLVKAIKRAESNDWRFEIDPDLSAGVVVIFRMTGLIDHISSNTS